MSIRIFVALAPPAPVRSALVAARELALARFGGKPVPDHNLHLTLAFLGATAEERLDELVSVVNAIPFTPLDLHLDEVGSFAGAKVVWLGSQQRHAGLDKLVAALWPGLRAAGFAFDAKDFNAHVTLLRKAVCPTHATAAVDWRADRLCIYESVSGLSGVDYHVRHRRLAA